MKPDEGLPVEFATSKEPENISRQFTCRSCEMDRPELMLRVTTPAYGHQDHQSIMKCNRIAGEKGYVLLVLLLFVALLSIGLLSMCEQISFQIRRDREEELLHRGAEYSRAVRKYVKQFGRYPSSVEALENTNNIRFLRKRFKDPITGGDFQMLSIADLHSYAGPGVPAIPKVIPPPPPEKKGSQHLDAASLADPDGTAGSNGDSEPTDNTPGADASAGDPNTPEPSPAGDADPSSESADAGSGSFVGVASRSKAQTIREFNHKNHYNEWQFVYDPSTDHAGLVTGPNRPLYTYSKPDSSEPPQQSSVLKPTDSVARKRKASGAR